MKLLEWLGAHVPFFAENKPKAEPIHFKISTDQAFEMAHTLIHFRTAQGCRFSDGVREEIAIVLRNANSADQAAAWAVAVMDRYEVSLRFPWRGARTLRSVLHAA